MRTVKRTGDEGQNFEETTRGELPHSISLETNAKGQVQVSVKVYFEALENASALATDLYLQVARQLNLKGVQVAGFGLVGALGQEAR